MLCTSARALRFRPRRHPAGKKVNRGGGGTEGAGQTQGCCAVRRCASSAPCSLLCLSDPMFAPPPVPKPGVTPCVCLALGVKRYSGFSLVSGLVWTSYQADHDVTASESIKVHNLPTDTGQTEGVEINQATLCGICYLRRDRRRSCYFSKKKQKKNSPGIHKR